MNTQRRILVVDDDPGALRALRFPLEQAGFTVEALEEPRLVAARALAFQPRLILMARQLSGYSAAEALRSLHSFPQTTSLPVAMLLSDGSELEVLRALWAGAVEVLFKPLRRDDAERLRVLVEELGAQSPRKDERRTVAENLLGTFRRARRDGTLVLNPGTPFEGRARFTLGTFTSAEYGPLAGVEALEEMLWFEHGVWRFEGTPWLAPEPLTPDLRASTAMAKVRAEQLRLEPLAVAFRPRIAFVDDDPDLRMLFEAQLSAAGFEVRTASHGGAGAELVSSFLPDLVLADLDMPVLDGWGMMRKLKADHRTREVPIVFYSGRDDVRDALSAARAGAHDYLSKAWRPEAVVRRMNSLVVPQMVAHAEMQKGAAVVLDLAVLGIRWALRRAEELKLTGTLEVSDEWGVHALRMVQGAPFDATSTASRRQSTAMGAVGALLVARGARGTFTPGPVKGTRRFQGTLSALVQRTSEMLNKLEAQVLDRKLSKDSGFLVDEALYAAFQKVGSLQDVDVARLLHEEALSPKEISLKLELSLEQVQESLREMLRRRVVRFPKLDSSAHAAAAPRAPVRSAS